MKHSYREMDGSLLRPVSFGFSNKYSIVADGKLQRWRYCTLTGHRNGSARLPRSCLLRGLTTKKVPDRVSTSLGRQVLTSY